MEDESMIECSAGLQTAQYQYRALRHEDEIRVICIEPGSYSDEAFSCHIIHCRRSSKKLKYEALSYAWGDLAKAKRIRVGHGTLEVTSNCFDALRRLRYENDLRIVWIDALCINQDDDEEKINQIRKMGQIYSRAKCVVVYLGEADRASDILFEWIKRASWDLESLSQAEIRRLCPEEVLTGAKKMIQRPWFQRVWVIQEVSDGSQANNVLIMCGDKIVEWSDFALSCESIFEKHAIGFKRTHMIGIPHTILVGGGAEKAGLLEILCRTRNLHATEPRDKFFSILSLINEDEAELMHLADYSQSTTIVYTNIGLYLLSKDSLDMLQAIRHPHSQYRSLASWIPDWSIATECDPFIFENGDNMWSKAFFFQSINDNMWNDNVGATPHFYVSMCCAAHNPSADHLYHPVLSLSGFSISRIQSVGKAFNFEQRLESMEAIEKIKSSRGQCSSHYLPPECIATETHYSYDFDALLRCHCPEGGPHDLFIDEAALNRCLLFLDEANHLGVAPKEAKVGDTIVFLAQAPKLCILRLRNGGGWNLISGECYLSALFWGPVEDAGWNMEDFDRWYPCLKNGQLDPTKKEIFEIW